MSNDPILSLTAAAVACGSLFVAINWHSVRSATFRLLDALDRFGSSVSWLKPR
jgi:hypothetical protein